MASTTNMKLPRKEEVWHTASLTISVQKDPPSFGVLSIGQKESHDPNLDARVAGKCSLWMSNCSSAVPYRKEARIIVTKWVASATSRKVANDHVLHWELSSQIYIPLRNSHRWTQDSCTRLFRTALLVIAKPWSCLEYT